MAALELPEEAWPQQDLREWRRVWREGRGQRLAQDRRRDFPSWQRDPERRGTGLGSQTGWEMRWSSWETACCALRLAVSDDAAGRGRFRSWTGLYLWLWELGRVLHLLGLSQREILKDAVLLALKMEGGRLRPRKAGVSRIWKSLPWSLQEKEDPNNTLVWGLLTSRMIIQLR